MNFYRWKAIDYFYIFFYSGVYIFSTGYLLFSRTSWYSFSKSSVKKISIGTHLGGRYLFYYFYTRQNHRKQLTLPYQSHLLYVWFPFFCMLLFDRIQGFEKSYMIRTQKLDILKEFIDCCPCIWSVFFSSCHWVFDILCNNSLVQLR